MVKLFLMFKDKVISEIPIDKGITTIGRSPGNDIPIDNLAVSSFHAKITQNSGVFVIEDLKSTNGTFVNNRRISQCQLSNNDQIVIGKHTLIFSILQGEEQSDSSDTTHKAILGIGEKTVMFDTRVLNAQTQQASQPAPVLGGFNLIEGSAEKKNYLLTERISTIGKSIDADIRVTGLFTPDKIAEISRSKEDYMISPTSFLCKPRLNGVKLGSPIRLLDGDIVEVCDLKLKFYLKH
jgi:pSer/pThr/pTyr-binding forkhead associated (FHA) protein